VPGSRGEGIRVGNPSVLQWKAATQLDGGWWEVLNPADQWLPGDHHLLLLGDSAGPEVVGIEIGGNDLRHGGIIRRRIVGEAHEEEAAQAAQVHGLETEAGAVDIGSEMLGECQRTESVSSDDNGRLARRPSRARHR
jgi:hypothetical protein